MADNTTLNAGAGGEDLASAEVTFSGDTASVQICGGGIVTGAAESYAVSLILGGAGNVAAGVQRVTLADDDPAVVDLAAIKDAVVAPGTGATNLGKARGSALGATDTGVAPLVVRNDDLADLAGADGDYTPLQVDPQGALYVNQGMAEMKQASGVAAGGAPGTDDMIAAVASRKIVICALALFATSTTTNSVFVDNVDNDLIANTGNPIALSLDADGDTVPGFILPFNPGGWCKTDTVNEAVTLNSSAAQDIVWCITYFETL